MRACASLVARRASSAFASSAAPSPSVQASSRRPLRSAPDDAPDRVEGEDVLWLRTPIRRASDLVDGQAWIQEYQQRLEAAGGGSKLQQSRVLREMAKVSPPGRKLKLPTGQDVIFWFNVGAPGPLQKRVHVTEAKCPHQGACLLSSELIEIEDAAGIASAVVRCPWHNKTFNLVSGLSPGNSEVLKSFPCRFMHGFWYVGVDPAPDAPHGAGGAPGAREEADAPRAEGVGGGDCGGAAEAGEDPARKKLRLVLDALSPEACDASSSY
mmetsp:Transcript_122625/g.392514  ORF Transcript_122625/g.392514 Transcript_122625/m.392514 type:complete len:268 (+) Transcript_122625:553-1356(+)